MVKGIMHLLDKKIYGRSFYTNFRAKKTGFGIIYMTISIRNKIQLAYEVFTILDFKFWY